MVTLPTRIPDCDSQSSALSDWFISSDASICSTIAFSPRGNSDHVVASFSIDFSLNSDWDASFRCIAYGYSWADWDGLCNHLRDVSWKDIFKLSVFAAASEFCEWVQVLELMHISLIVNIKSCFTYLHCFQMLVLLPYFIKITFIIYTNKTNLVNLKQISDRLAINTKELLKLPNLHMLI